MTRRISTTSQQRRRRTGARGFTLVEFVMASTISAVVVLGVYEVFRQVLEVEERYGVASRQTASAAAVAEHLTSALEGVVNLPQAPAITVQRHDRSGVYSLVCRTGGARYTPGSVRDVGLQLRQYQWGFDQEDRRAGTIQLHLLDYAGSTDISASTSGEGQALEQRWSKVQPRVIASGLDAVSVLLKPSDKPTADWVDTWEGDAGDVMIRITIDVGGFVAERIVVPRVTGVALE